MEPDPDAPENTFCFNCKWYAGEKKDAGGKCMFNPPTFADGIGGVRPYTSAYDYCSLFEKE